jgi:hypothetical protein
VGPFKVLQVITPVSFRIKLPPGVCVNDVVHASQLEPWYSASFSRQTSTALTPIVHDANRFEFDQILDVAYNSTRTGILLRVRWALPYNSHEDDTWEPLRHLSHVDALHVFLSSSTWTKFSSTKDFTRFRNRYPSRLPRSFSTNSADVVLLRREECDK